MHRLRMLSTPMELLAHLTSLALLAWLTRKLFANLRFLRQAHCRAMGQPQQAQKAMPVPRVSILVPVRNEAATITSCLTSLLQQTYPESEVIALDDGSTDGTGAQLDVLAAHYPQLRVIHAIDDVPPGWNGKSYACQRLAEHATGDWLLFTDADTLHTPQSVARGLVQAQALDVALLSAFPAQQTETWSERLMVSFVLDFLPLIGLDFCAIWRGTSKRSAANGQYLLARAAAYRAIGGHASVRSALVDDFALAERFRSQGYPIALVDGRELLSCRMYASSQEVWDGFSKNVLAALSMSAWQQASRQRPPWRMFWQGPLFAWGYACLFIIPFWRVVFGRRRWLAGIEIGWLGLLRWIATRHLKRPIDEVVTTPLAAWGVMAIGLNALLRRLRGGEIRWKGRLYRN